ncbi:Ger(x)C family spore germination protein [Brevibacillus brevis]|uniref:Ger(X)C family spore germination protein n=1 Tax=Brevibacillus brevis TaxID=1393 RepID=A0ABY9SWI4_BREBE|nr:Ger(x)C family spore germination protein [Brevibacillus brevis]WNC12185.1 Ger(x)C family spore germination protein [Brevibacillus brevis]
MKKSFAYALLSLTLITSGCLGQNRLDELTLVLTFGVDQGKNGEMEIYTAVPVFHKEARKKTELLHTRASTFREGRDRLDNQANGVVETGKVQNILISKRLMMRKGLFDLLDVIYRDPKSALMTDLIVTDDPIEQVMDVDIQDKPRFPVYLRELVRSSHISEASVSTNVRRAYDQFYEKGITPYVTEMKLSENKLKISGTALLDKRGYYVASLDTEESIQLLILQKDTHHPIFMTVQLKGKDVGKKDEESQSISYSIDYTHSSYKTYVEGNQFHFDLHFRYSIVLTELLVQLHPMQDKEKLEKAIASEMKKKMEAVIAKFQKHHLDPIGLGKYARAYAYPQWKQVEDDWGRAFSQAKVRVIPEVRMISIGSLRK